MIYELIWSPSEKKAFMSTKRMLSLTNKNLKKKKTKAKLLSNGNAEKIDNWN